MAIVPVVVVVVFVVVVFSVVFIVVVIAVVAVVVVDINFAVVVDDVVSDDVADVDGVVIFIRFKVLFFFGAGAPSLVLMVLCVPITMLAFF